MISVDEADNLLAQHSLPTTDVLFPIDYAAGKVLREDIVADRDFPPFHRAAMDGIALRYANLGAPERLIPIENTAYAGAPQLTLNNPDAAIEIMTGAVLPEGCDTIVRLEDVVFQTIDGARYAKVLVPPQPTQHVHHKGSDRKQGDLIVPKGRILSAAEIAVAASVGKTHLRVNLLPRISVISTGDELVAVDAVPLPHQIRISNAYAIQALLNEHSYSAKLYRSPDDEWAFSNLLSECLTDSDILILTGGVSAGKADFVPSVLEQHCIEKIFHKIKQRPGKPMWFGKRTSDGKIVFALPGNPVSTVVCMLRYVLPFLKRMAGCTEDQHLSAVLDEPVEFKPALTYFLPVKLHIHQGVLHAQPLKGHGSGDFANLADCDGFLELPEAQTLFQKGEAYTLWLYRALK